MAYVESGIPLGEQNTTYFDGVVETLLSVPDTTSPIAIRLRSSGWVAFGLAMVNHFLSSPVLS